MVSNPIGKCCVTGFKHDGTPVGKLEASFVKTELGEVQAYIITPAADKDKKQGLLLYVCSLLPSPRTPFLPCPDLARTMAMMIIQTDAHPLAASRT